jgi:hypothetical protein
MDRTLRVTDSRAGGEAEHSIDSVPEAHASQRPKEESHGAFASACLRHLGGLITSRLTITGQCAESHCTRHLP